MDTEDSQYQGPQRILKSHDFGPNKRRRITSEQDFSQARAKLGTFGKGIFKPPYGIEKHASKRLGFPSIPRLPPVVDVNHLLERYHSFFHPIIPIVPWPYFTENVKSVCAKGSLDSETRIWIALFFAILALGALQARDHRTQEYFNTAQSTFDFWADHITLDHPRVALLCTIYLNEINRRDTAWTCLGVAVRMSQAIGLQADQSDFGDAEKEARRRLWWCIYSYDK